MDMKDRDRRVRWAVQLMLDRDERSGVILKDKWKILSERNNRSSSGQIVHVMKEELKREGLL